MSDMPPPEQPNIDVPDARYVCDEHHWISKGVQGLLIRWVIECSFCGAYNVDEMNAYTREIQP